MMNSDISRIPIQSLGSVISLTDILPELPLPSPIHSSLSNQSLLVDPQLIEQSSVCLTSRDNGLMHSLAMALGSTTTDNIEFMDGSSSDAVDKNTVPTLLRAIVEDNTSVFQNKKGWEGFYRAPSQNTTWNMQHSSSSSSGMRSCSGGLQANYGQQMTSGHWNPALTNSISSAVYTQNQQGLGGSQYFELAVNGGPPTHNKMDGVDEDDSASPKKRKKKKKKKKKHRDDESSLNEDTSYSVVQVKEAEDKISLKISLKRPTEDPDSHQTPADGPVSVGSKDSTTKEHHKERKKKKRDKDKDKEKRSSKGNEMVPPPVAVSQPVSMPNVCQNMASNLPSSKHQAQPQVSMPHVDMSMNSLPSVSHHAANLAMSTAPSSMSLANHHPMHQLPNQTPYVDGLDTDMILGDINSLRNDYLSGTVSSNGGMEAGSHYFPHNMFDSNMFDSSLLGPLAPISTHLPVNSQAMTSPLFPGLTPTGFPSTSSGMSYPISSHQQQQPHNLPYNMVSRPDGPANQVYQNQLPLNQAYRNDQNMPIPHNSRGKPDYFFDDAGATHAQIPHNSVAGSNRSILANALTASMSTNEHGIGRGKPEAYMDHLESEPGAPHGLASYMSKNATHGGGQDDKHESPKRRAPVNRRPKRRRNELDDLKHWQMKDPTEAEPSWDKRLGTYSAAISESVKKRKRQARHGGGPDSAFVFEDDEDYPSPGRGRVGDREEGDADSGVGGGSEGGDPVEAVLNAGVGTRSGGARTGGGSGMLKSYAGMDDEGGEEEDGGGRRKKKDDDEPFEIKLKEPADHRYPHLMKKTKEASRRRERVSLGFHSLGSAASAGGLSAYTTQELVESNCCKRFNRTIDNILTSADEVDLKQLLGETEEDEESGVILRSASADELPPEIRLSHNQLSDLCKESAKLKAVAVMNSVSGDRLVKLLTVLLLNIRDGDRILFKPHDHGDDEDGKASTERVMRGIEAGLTALHIMTSPEMPKEVYVEDVIEKTISLGKFQLINCIYAEYDPAYRVDNTAKETQGSIKTKRARERDHGISRPVRQLYNRLVETVGCLAELVEMQELTDDLVLQLSSLGVGAFFVENVSELQLNALKLVTTIFSRYEPHRKLIMEDILASLARLPSSKKNLRSYRLNSEESIQMLTALALLLVQSVIQLPKPEQPDPTLKTDQVNKESGKEDKEVTVITSYQNAMRTAHTFLTVFLRKSTTKGEDDYRMIFENFVNDLLLAVNKPEWPAAEVYLSMLGSLLVQQFNNKSLDQNTRVASVDYLGTVASTLRRDAVNSQLKEKDIDAVIKDLITGGSREDEEEEEAEKEEEEEEIQPRNTRNRGGNAKSKAESKAKAGKKNGKGKKKDPTSALDRIQSLRDALLDYLAAEEVDPTVLYARKFYLSQWLSDCTKETRLAQNRLAQAEENGTSKKDADDDEENQVKGESGDATVVPADPAEVMLLAESRRKHLFHKMVESKEEIQRRRRKVHGMGGGGASTKEEGEGDGGEEEVAPEKRQFVGTMDYEEACLVCRYLASLRPFSQSFDLYLGQIRKLLNETSVAVRTKAMRCLSAVVEADPSVLGRKDIWFSVQASFLDSSTSVREAAIDLVGKYVLIQPQLTPQYYPMLSERILDKGISVRKRVIKIFRDICMEQPDFCKIPEICVKIIRRVNDEESIKKLVNEVFQAMWFTPVRDKETVKLFQKVMNITDVVAACRETGFEWFEQFLQNLLKREESEKVKPVEKACKQIVECLVQNIMRLEEVSSNSNQRLVACLATLHLLTKIRPELMVQSCMTLQAYLNIKCSTSDDNLILHYVTRILEVTVPLMEHPSESFLSQLEEEMVRMTLKYGKLVIESCVSCLGAVVNKVSKNYSLVKDCFNRFFNALLKCRKTLEEGPDKTISAQTRPSLLRALFTVGLLCKHFDFDKIAYNSKPLIRNEVFDTLMFFTELVIEDIELRKKALSGIGFLCTRHCDLLGLQRLRDYYKEQLTSDKVQAEMKCLVLENIYSYLLDEENRMIDEDACWKDNNKKESLKEMNDVASSMGSTVAQFYLSEVLDCFLHANDQVRVTALSVVTTILRQGLIHPVQTVPSLICLQTDPDPTVRTKTDLQLQEIDKKFAGFINMRSIAGIRLSYALQRVIQNKRVIRGVRDSSVEIPLALNHHLYSMLRANRQNRRSLFNGLLGLFDENQMSQKVTLAELVYVADNIAYFPYQCTEEPLYIIHSIDLIVSMAGSTILQNVRQALFPELAEQYRLASLEMAAAEAAEKKAMEEGEEEKEVRRLPLHKRQPPRMVVEEDEDEEGLLKRLPEQNNSPAFKVVQDSVQASEACVLMLTLKQFLKDVYGINDGKIQKYSPSDSAKLWEKQLTRRSNFKFEPKHCLQMLEKMDPHKEMARGHEAGAEKEVTPNQRRDMVRSYINFRNLMLTIDPDDNPDSDSEQQQPGAAGATFHLVAGEVPTIEQGRMLRIELPKLDLRTLPPVASVVPKAENSDESDDSDNSNAGGSSRLMLAQSAPTRRKTVQNRSNRNKQSSRGGGFNKSPKKRRKRLQTNSSSSSEEESESEEESSDAS